MPVDIDALGARYKLCYMEIAFVKEGPCSADHLTYMLRKVLHCCRCGDNLVPAQPGTKPWMWVGGDVPRVSKPQTRATLRHDPS